MPANDPSFEALYVPDNSTPEDLSRAFVATGLPEFVEGAVTPGRLLTRRIAVVGGNYLGAAECLLPSTDAVGHARIVYAANGAPDVTVNLPAGCTTLSGAAFVTLVANVCALFVKVSATQYLVLKGSA